ncbi:ATP-binding protein [Pseudomonas sp. VEM90]
MSPVRPLLRRNQLANALAQDLAGESLVDYSSGMFLAAPRRTGKSTFLNNDFIPECVQRGWLPVYVDLWSDRDAAPAQLISGAIGTALARFEGALARTAKKAGIDKVNLLRTLSWDFTRPQLPAGTTLAQALAVLHQVSGQLVVLIIDEAQHALNSEDGLNAMFALKAARDHLNRGDRPDGLRLVFTGSSRDKLANLVLKSKQPFFGASITPFPLLGREYVEFITALWNRRLADSNQFKVEDLAYAFELVGRRPEMLNKLLAEVSVGLGEAGNLGELLRNGALNHQAGVWSDYESAWNELTPLQQAVLEVMAERTLGRQPFSPFTEQTLVEVSRKLEQAQAVANVNTANVQKALDALRDKELVWKANRGEYTLEDTSMAEWLARDQAVASHR